MIETLTFLKGFSKIYEIEQSKLPYHINIIDELRANENAHSRILQKLLQYHVVKSNSYDILESFIEFILEKYSEKTDFKHISVSTPIITQEHQRIDLWIRDRGKYAIVIENKVHYATDQNLQLQRYIDSTIKDGFTEDQIFVIYLPPTYIKEPDDDSWGNYYDSDIQKDRFLNMSFKDDILPWLKYKLLPEIKLKDRYLISSIEQYIDHLEGMFSLRRINKNMNMELSKYIDDELKLSGRLSVDDLVKLSLKKEKVQTLLNFLDEKEAKMIQNFFSSWHSELEKDYRSFEKVGNWQVFQPFINIGLKIQNYSVLIEYNRDDGVYYGMGRHYATEELDDNLNFKEIVDKFKLSTTRCNGWWYGWSQTNFSEAYDCLKGLIEEVNKSQ